MTRFAITGATGCLGRALVARLEPGHAIRALARTPGSFTEAMRTRGHTIVPGDLDDLQALERLVAGADVVFHCAAKLGNDDEAASERVNVEGTRALAEACARAKVRRLVYVSSISVYSATVGAERIDEGDLPQNVERLCAYARTKLRGEIAVRDVARRTGLTFTIVRPTNVYGPWSAPWVMNWLQLFERLPVRFGNVAINVVHAADVAQGLIKAADSADAAGEVLHVGHEQELMTDYLRRVGELTGRSTYRLPDAIDWAIRSIAHFGYRAKTGRTLGLPLLQSRRFSHQKAERMVGYKPEVSLADGFAELRRWYHEQRTGRNRHGATHLYSLEEKTTS